MNAATAATQRLRMELSRPLGGRAYRGRDARRFMPTGPGRDGGDIAKQAQKQRHRARLPDELAPARLARRGTPVAIALAVVVLVFLKAPGLGQVRHHLAEADAGWLLLGVA